MKIRLYIILFSSLLLTSCSDWLDVQPSTQIEKDKAIESIQGFRDILTGTYIRLKSNSLYGQELTWNSVEMLAQHWETSSKESSGYQLSNYDYNGSYAVSTTGSIFNNLYKAIADVNGILDVIDDKQSMLVNGNYEIIKGEALAIRAFCHFDILRLFGPVPNQEASNNAILPYVKTVSTSATSHISYAEYTKELLNDLNQAESYLQKVDLILQYGLKDLNLGQGSTLTSSDTFFAYRQMRMNYYAVLALKARVYLWMGNKSEALVYAQKVIQAKDKNNKPIFRLGTKADMEIGDYNLSSEHILNLYNHLLSDASWQNNLNGVYALRSQVEKYYSGTDVRMQQLWIEVLENSIKEMHIKKYQQLETSTDQRNSWSKNAIPLIRLYEMYLIEMECSSLTDATNIWNNTLSAVRDENKVSGFNSQKELEDLIILEYNREFYGEGQAFFAYKRLGRSTIIGTDKVGNSSTYVIPLPTQEFSGINGSGN